MTRFDTYGGRKFIIAWAVLITATVLQWHGKLDPAGTTYALLIGTCVAAYITGNVYQKKTGGVPKDEP